MELYRPSNGTEGMIFEDKFCMNCESCNPDPEKCHNVILCFFANGCSISDKNFPKEWCYVKDEPTCTAWRKWDWSISKPPSKRVLKVKPNKNQIDLFKGGM